MSHGELVMEFCLTTLESRRLKKGQMDGFFFLKILNGPETIDHTIFKMKVIQLNNMTLDCQLIACILVVLLCLRNRIHNYLVI